MACVKTEDGIIIGIYESNDKNLDDDDFNINIHNESKLETSDKEIRNILDKFKL